VIINGNPAGNVSFWSKHLLCDDQNELTEVREISGVIAQDLPSALREMQDVAKGSRSQGNFMYQANINPQPGEQLTPEQWIEAIDTLERNLGLEGHQRVVVEHVKHGRQHYHVIWNRVDILTMKVADMGGNWIVHERTSRELEARLGLTPTPVTAPDQRKQHDQLWETRAAERSGISIKAMRDELTQIWESSDSGMAFKTAIEERGYILAKGDRRDFCVVDREGDAHSLARRLDGVKAAGVRTRMSDVNRDELPSVEEARERQRSTPPREIHVEPNSRVPHEVRKQNSTEAILDDGLRVANKLTGGVEKLADFVADLLIGGTPSPKRDPLAERVEQIIAQRRALTALQQIRDSIEGGKTLKPEDLQNLTPEHLNNIRAKGDDYLRDLIRQMEQSGERDRGRERER
jgi:Relaxase/Mobilisation nuclease domain